MRKILFLIIISALTMVSCKEKPKPTPQEQIAGKDAVEYYGYLQRHDFPAFVDGMYFAKPIPKEYRKLLEKNAEQVAHEQDSLRGGIKSVKLSKADLMKKDTTLAAVYLLLQYGDSTSEEILVPMVKRKDVWYMK